MTDNQMTEEEERAHALARILDEESSGVLTFKDGTVMVDGKATKVGSRVIVAEDGSIAGWKPDEK